MYLSYIRIATTLPNLQLFLYPLLNPVIKTFTFSQTFVEKAVERAVSSKHYSQENTEEDGGGAMYDMRAILLSFAVSVMFISSG